MIMVSGLALRGMCSYILKNDKINLIHLAPLLEGFFSFKGINLLKYLTLCSFARFVYMVRTSDFQSGKAGSIPASSTKNL